MGASVRRVRYILHGLYFTEGVNRRYYVHLGDPYCLRLCGDGKEVVYMKTAGVLFVEMRCIVV